MIQRRLKLATETAKLLRTRMGNLELLIRVKRCLFYTPCIHLLYFTLLIFAHYTTICILKVYVCVCLPRIHA